MHQKKSEVQIGKESSCISSDFNPTPPLVSSSSLSPEYPLPPQHTAIQIYVENDIDPIPPPHTPTKTTPHKRPHLGNNPSKSVLKSPSLSNSLHKYPFSSVKAQRPYTNFHIYSTLCHLRRILRLHIRLILLLSLPFFYFVVSHPTNSFLLDFLSAFAFSSALLFSLNLALPRLPSIRLFLSRSLPIKLSSSKQVSRNALPVFWSIGSRAKIDKRVNSGCYVQAYSNGDVYEGEFHKGKCSGSGVYYYYMSGRATK